MKANIVPFQSQEEQAWEDFREARAKAEASQRLEDGIAAGKAYGRFFRLFAGPARRSGKSKAD